MQKKIPILIVAYNRPKSLERLLKSVQKALFGERKDIPLIISIDNSGNEDCLIIAKSFQWNHGTKEIIFHPNRLGLKDHVLSCGDISSRFDGVIILEDDLIVSPNFYDYIIQADTFFKSDDRIAGIALYSYKYSEFSGLPFEALDDGYDNFFMQVPCSSGQFWSSVQWTQFKSFLNSPDASISSEDILPDVVINYWPERTSWKRLFYKYMVSRGKYFVYPRVALSTNMGDAGAHHIEETNVHQTPILINKKSYSFASFEDSLSIYDYLYELSPVALKRLVPSLTKMSVECDLHGQKNLSKVSSDFLISIKETNSPTQTFGSQLFPAELNIALNVEGEFYKLAQKETFQEVSRGKIGKKARNELKCAPHILDSFGKEEGISLVKGSKSFKLGNALLYPLSLLKATMQKIKWYFLN